MGLGGLGEHSWSKNGIVTLWLTESKIKSPWERKGSKIKSPWERKESNNKSPWERKESKIKSPWERKESNICPTKHLCWEPDFNCESYVTCYAQAGVFNPR